MPPHTGPVHCRHHRTPYLTQGPRAHRAPGPHHGERGTADTRYHEHTVSSSRHTKARAHAMGHRGHTVYNPGSATPHRPTDTPGTRPTHPVRRPQPAQESRGRGGPHREPGPRSSCADPTGPPRGGRACGGHAAASSLPRGTRTGPRKGPWRPPAQPRPSLRDNEPRWQTPPPALRSPRAASEPPEAWPRRLHRGLPIGARRRPRSAGGTPRGPKGPFGRVASRRAAVTPARRAEGLRRGRLHTSPRPPPRSAPHGPRPRGRRPPTAGPASPRAGPLQPSPGSPPPAPRRLPGRHVYRRGATFPARAPGGKERRSARTYQVSTPGGKPGAPRGSRLAARRAPLPGGLL